MQATGPHAAQSVSEHLIETHPPQEVPASSSEDVTDPTQVPLDEPSSMGLDSASISHTSVEETSAPVENISSDTVGTSETSATPHLPLEQAAITEPKEVEHEAIVTGTPSDEVVVSPDTPALEEATAPSIPAVTPPKRVSDTPTIPVISTAEASPSKNTEPAARSPRKRNFLQRLFSILSRRKPKK